MSLENTNLVHACNMERLGTAFVLFMLSFLYIADGNVISLGSMLEWLDPDLTSMFGAYGRFNGYGCYCGIGGSGKPVDEIDCCCQMHDECYESLTDDGTCTSGGTFSHLYTFKKYKRDGKPLIKCKESGDPCANKLCDCDKKVATCLALHESKYNMKYTNYNWKSDCDKEMWIQADFCPN